MFKLFSRKKSQTPAAAATIPPLYFKDGKAAMKYAAMYLECPIVAGRGLPAIVGLADNDQRIYELLVAASDGGFVAFSKSSGDKGPALQRGDFVMWVPGKYVPELAASFADKRSGWVGLTVCTLKPELIEGLWTIREHFTA